MAISNLGSKISTTDKNKVANLMNPPEMDPEFSGGGGSGDGSSSGSGGSEFDEFGGLFDDISDIGDFLGGDSNNGAGGSTPGGQPGGQLGGQSGGLGQFGQLSNTGTGIGTGGSPIFGASAMTPGQLNIPGMTQQQQPVQYKDTPVDLAFKASGEAAKSFFEILKEMIKSVKTRNADDLGYFARNLILTGGIMAVCGVVFLLIGSATKLSFLSIKGLPLEIITAGLVVAGTGMGSIGAAAIAIAQTGPSARLTASDLSELTPEDAGLDSSSDVSTQDYEDNLSDILDDLFDDSEDSGDSGGDLFSSSSDFSTGSNESTDIFQSNLDSLNSIPEISFEKSLDNVQENQVLNRQTLFNTFKTFFPCNTVGFSTKKEIDKSDSMWLEIQAVCTKALANITKKEVEDIPSLVTSIIDGCFSLEVKLERLKGMNNVDALARELETWLRDDPEDLAVSVSVKLSGDFYLITINKGDTHIVTFGDVFHEQSVCDYILDSKHKLPIIKGITASGEVVLGDCKLYDAMMITGKPRSGKSWYVLSLLLMLMATNSPEDVQFIIVDPKESSMFKRLSLMPHVCGLHSHKVVMDIMEDLIENEGKRRKKLLADNYCENIWDLKKKGINIPIIFLFIDEILTIQDYMKDNFSEFQSKMKVIVSQLPSAGIKMIIIPHRATSVIDKTSRVLFQYTAALKANTDEIKDTLDVKSWDIPLVNPGDTALKTSDMPNAQFVHGMAVTPDDDKNMELIVNMARAYYKMGVEFPDMSYLRMAANRNEDFVKSQLGIGNGVVQYDAQHLFDDLD